MMRGLSDSPWAVPMTILLFCALAFIGAPQWMLITGTVLAFGVWEGGVLSWVGSLSAAMLGFAIGHIVGAERLRRIDADLVQKLSAGTALGILPKIIIICLISQGLISSLSGSLMAVFFAGLAGVAILLSWLAKKRLAAHSRL